MAIDDVISQDYQRILDEKNDDYMAKIYVSGKPIGGVTKGLSHAEKMLKNQQLNQEALVPIKEYVEEKNMKIYGNLETLGKILVQATKQQIYDLAEQPFVYTIVPSFIPVGTEIPKEPQH